MNVRKSQAMKMRLKGRSYNEINKELGIPKSTLSDWFSKMKLSDKANARLKGRVYQGTLNGLVKRNKAQTHLAQKRARETQREAADEVKKFSNYELLLVGAALYWGEGYKKAVVKNGKERTHHMIGFSNTDPIMIQIFMKFLREVLNIDNSAIKVNVRIFEHINADEAIQYWSNITKLPVENFHAPSYTVSKSSQGKKPYNQLPYGTIQVRVCDTQKFHQIMGWIEGLKKAI